MSELAIIGVLKDQLNLANQRHAQLELLLVREREDRNAVIAEATTELNVQIGYLEEKVKELEDERLGLCGTLAAQGTEIADLKQRLDGAIFTTNHNFMSAEKWKEQAISIQETNVTMAAGLYEILTMGTCGEFLSPEAQVAKEVLEETEWKKGKEIFPDVGSSTPFEVVKDEE